MTRIKQIEGLERALATCAAELAEANKRADDNATNGDEWKKLASERERVSVDLRDKNSDLKKRLSGAEQENQRMRGYIQRVQEDDTVREELVAIGDLGGETQLVPKRKRTEFPSPNQYTDFTPDNHLYIDQGRRERNTKHWVTY